MPESVSPETTTYVASAPAGLAAKPVQSRAKTSINADRRVNLFFLLCLIGGTSSALLCIRENEFFNFWSTQD